MPAILKLQKLRIHRPAECRCANCCQSEDTLRAARLAQKRRLLPTYPQRVIKPWPAYKQRRVQKERKALSLLLRKRSRVRPASLVRRVYGVPRWQRWLPTLRAASARL